MKRQVQIDDQELQDTLIGLSYIAKVVKYGLPVIAVFGSIVIGDLIIQRLRDDALAVYSAWAADVTQQD